MHGGRGAKGSLNDRIISFLFRKRYKEYLKKRENYTKEEREKAIEYLKKIKEFDIETNVSVLEDADKKLLEERFQNIDISDIEMIDSGKTNKLKEISNGKEDFDIKEATDLLNDFDLSKDLYNFDDYNYIDKITTGTELSKEDEYGILDVDKEIEKRKDEKTIIEEVKKFVNESKEQLEDMKFEIEYIKSEIDKQYTQEQIDELRSKYNELNEKITKLRKQYHNMKEKYNFEGYELLDNLTLLESVDDFKTKADLEELELMVDACKYEVEAIDSVVEENKKSKKVGISIDDKKEELIDRDNSFNKAKEEKYRLNNLNKTIEEELANEALLLRDIQNHVNNLEQETVRITDITVNTSRMFRSFLRIAAGIITAPLFNIFGTMLGVHLIRSGLRELRQSLIPEEVERVEYINRYRDVEREIANARNDVDRTLIMINDSFDTIKDIKKLYKQKFEKYAAHLPEYSKLWSDIETLEKKLEDCKTRVNDYKESLTESYNKNNVRVYNSRS